MIVQQNYTERKEQFWTGWNFVHLFCTVYNSGIWGRFKLKSCLVFNGSEQKPVTLSHVIYFVVNVNMFAYDTSIRESIHVQYTNVKVGLKRQGVKRGRTCLVRFVTGATSCTSSLINIYPCLSTTLLLFPPTWISTTPTYTWLLKQ